MTLRKEFIQQKRTQSFFFTSEIKRKKIVFFFLLFFREKDKENHSASFFNLWFSLFPFCAFKFPSGNLSSYEVENFEADFSIRETKMDYYNCLFPIFSLSFYFFRGICYTQGSHLYCFLYKQKDIDNIVILHVPQDVPTKIIFFLFLYIFYLEKYFICTLLHTVCQH